MSETIFTRWSDVPLEPMNPLLGRQFISSERLTVGRITLAKGAHVPTHTHPNEQAVCILSGALKFVLYEPNAASRRTVWCFVVALTAWAGLAGVPPPPTCLPDFP